MTVQRVQAKKGSKTTAQGLLHSGPSVGSPFPSSGHQECRPRALVRSIQRVGSNGGFVCPVKSQTARSAAAGQQWALQVPLVPALPLLVMLSSQEKSNGFSLSVSFGFPFILTVKMQRNLLGRWVLFLFLIVFFLSKIQSLLSCHSSSDCGRAKQSSA